MRNYRLYGSWFMYNKALLYTMVMWDLAVLVPITISGIEKGGGGRWAKYAKYPPPTFREGGHCPLTLKICDVAAACT